MVFQKAADAGKADFSGATLVVADVSRGNVGQLAADLLITTLQMRRVGYFNDADVLPAVGVRAFLPNMYLAATAAWRQAMTFPSAVLSAGMEAGKLRVNTELFVAADAKLFVLQQRYDSIPCSFLSNK